MSQSCNSQEQSDLKQQAIDWLVLLRSDDVSDDELYAFSDWLAQDHAHSVAFSEAEILFDEMAQAAQYRVDIDQPQLKIQQKKISEKHQEFRVSRWFVPAFAIAASYLVIALYLPQQMNLFDHFNSDYSTHTGELQEIQLSDGSRLLLNTYSAVSIDYDDQERRVRLHHGQVRFTVAKDTTRPFVVDINGLTVTALGTVFQISKHNDQKLTVTVQEHAVEVNKVKEKKHNKVIVNTGQQLSYQDGQNISQPKTISLQQQTAWQQHRLIINDRPLGELIAELEKYRNGRIFLSDNQLKNLRVTGVFSLDNPDAILKSVCKILNLQETRVAGAWSIIHR